MQRWQAVQEPAYFPTWVSSAHLFFPFVIRWLLHLQALAYAPDGKEGGQTKHTCQRSLSLSTRKTAAFLEASLNSPALSLQWLESGHMVADGLQGGLRGCAFVISYWRANFSNPGFCHRQKGGCVSWRQLAPFAAVLQRRRKNRGLYTVFPATFQSFLMFPFLNAQSNDKRL